MKNNSTMILFCIMLATVSLCNVAFAENGYVVHVREQAATGNAWAEKALGDVYYFGVEVKSDFARAVQWYRKAADKNYAEAQYELGRAYSNGEGVEQDLAIATQWYRKAAEQEHIDAQFDLGTAYQFGDGVAKDKSTAVEWFMRAAMNGHYRAPYELATAYWSGEGAESSFTEAFVWYYLADEMDDSRGREWADTDWHYLLSRSAYRDAENAAVERRDEIRETMDERTPENISERIAVAPPSAKPFTAEQVFDRVWQSVVYLETENSSGSGVIVQPNIVATNCHVIEDADEIWVSKANDRHAQSGWYYPATRRAGDEDLDFCLLNVSDLWGSPVTIRRYDTLKIGEVVYALGAPDGYELSLSAGVVSQKREDEGIQTDVSISPGSSGGGLFDSAGYLIGLTTSSANDLGNQSINFAIPADLVLEF